MELLALMQKPLLILKKKKKHKNSCLFVFPTNDGAK